MASAAEQAVRRLETALRGLEVAIGQRLSRVVGSASLAAQVETLAADRARLAETLDQAQARAVRLESVNRDVSRRLGAAAEAIRDILTPDSADL